MNFPLLALLFSTTVLAKPADTADLPAPETITSYVTVTKSTIDIVTSTAIAEDEDVRRSMLVSVMEALEPTYPSWVKSVLATAIPISWKERLSSDPWFADSEVQAEASGMMPAWYSSLPSDVKYIITSDEAVYASRIADITWSSFIISTTTTTPNSSNASSSLSTFSSTRGTTSSIQSKAPETSTSSGGAPVATGGLAISIAGAAGILGLALAL
ncbi:hypothetical protein N7462_000660 [Penicillium macrosclerotiorum]|uniref:uncharacterized protein n=1 Tax=Penicillium macrosclerotiorum TaxID=303699 RepID=UPI0025472174|nr:uncharacterized protein N7462_000660 [Penicillium macrosclerotiorum]KAJ5698655.1 hypothetical protein N7462_000660 [Penicillium macrosclerotiorum]